MNTKYYSVRELVESAIKEYQLHDDESSRKAYEMMFRRTLEKLGYTVVDDVDVIYEVVGKSKTKKFSQRIKDRLFFSKNIYNYFIDNSVDEAVKNKKSYDELISEIRHRRDDAIMYENNRDSYDDAVPTVSNAQLQQHKRNMMLEAIFNIFYTEFDEEQLRYDLNLALTSDEFNVTPDLIDAEYRYHHPEGNYFHKKITS